MLNDLRDRYITLFGGEEPTPPEDLTKLENDLGINLPANVKEVASFYSGGLLGGISIFNFCVQNNQENILSENLRLREAINLPDRFLVFAEPPESLLFLDIDTGKVWMIDATDANKLSLGIQKFHNPDIWNNYVDFFDYLLSEEDEERKFMM